MPASVSTLRSVPFAWVAPVLVFLAYIAGGKLGLYLSLVEENVTLVWPPAGIAVAGILLGGRRIWPALAAAAFLTTLSTGAPLAFALATAAGNSLQAIVAQGLLRRVPGFSPALSQLKDVAALAVIGAALSCVVGATVGTIGLCLAGLAPWQAAAWIWLVWWAGDAMGVLLVAPAILTAKAWLRDRWTLARVVEASALLLTLVAISMIVYAGHTTLHVTDPLPYLGIPPVIWAAVRFRTHGAALAILVLATIAVVGTANGSGIFARGDLHENLLHLHGLLSCIAVLGLGSAAALYERSRAQWELEAAHRKLEQRVAERTEDLARANAMLEGEVEERRRAELELTLFYGICRAIEEAPDVIAALQVAMHHICGKASWDYAGAWLPSADGTRLELRAHWHRADALDGVCNVSHALPFDPKDGLPGRVWQSREAEWLLNVPATDLTSFPCSGPAAGAKLNTGFAVPIVAGEEVLAVLEFLLHGDRDEDRELMQAVAAVTAQLGNVLQKKRAEEALEVANAKLVEITSGIPGAVYQFEMDDDGTIRFPFMSSGVEELYGVRAAEGMREPLVLFQPVLEQDLPRLHESIAESRMKMIPWRCEYRITVEGRERWLRGHSVPRRISERTVRWNGILVDISTEKALEAQLVHAQKLEAVGQLTGGLAHDFNNLLTVIVGNSELLVEELVGQPDAHEMAGIILAAAERGALLNERLLAFARRQALRPEVLDVNTVVSALEPLLRRTLGEQIEIRQSLSGDLRRAFVDRAQLESALLNLAVNAQDAMPGGGKLVIETQNVSLDQEYATVHDAAAGDYIVITVGDTGTGIPPEVLSRVFEPFFTTKEVGKGSGLGLSMVYGFTKQSKGHASIYSELGYGTTIRLYLPVAHAEGERPQSLAQRDAVDVPRGSETILVVEDEPQVREFVARQLRSFGYTVTETPDGPSALAVLASSPPFDLLFTDVVLPNGLTGRDIAAHARQRQPGLRVLFTSGYGQNVIVHQGMLDPGVHLLRKPYRKLELAQAIRNLLDQAQAVESF